MQVIDIPLAAGDPEVGGFSGGFTVGHWAYLVPSRTYAGPVGGVNTRMKAGVQCIYVHA
jgi:hypothetical protein